MIHRSINVDVDLDDILSGMSRYDRREMLEKLQEEGYIDQDLTITCEGYVTTGQLKSLNNSTVSEDFDQAIKKLIGNSWRLTREDEEIILKVANKLP